MNLLVSVELSDEMLTYDDAIPGLSNMPPPPPPASTSITASDFSSSASQPRPVTTQRGKRSTKRKTLHSKKGKAKGRKKVASETVTESDENCAICNRTEIEGEDWISCDICHLWYHRTCVNIDDEEWNHLTVEDAVYTCPLCQ